MKLNMKLVQNILEYLESDGHPYIFGKSYTDDFSNRKEALGDFTYEEIKYHTVLLGEGGYVKTIDHIGVEDYTLPERLTMKGHLYLEEIRRNNENIYKSTDEK